MTIVLRDLYSADLELAEAVHERGYVKTSLPDSLVYDAYDIEFLTSAGRAVGDDELAHLYELYLAVQARGRDLNSFPLPRTFLREMLAHSSWELMTLRLKETGRIVAFGAHFVGARHYAPMIVGLD